MISKIGIIDSIDAKGSGQISVEILIRLLPENEHDLSYFWAFWTSRDEVLALLQAAFDAMWNNNTVKITAVEKNGNQVVKTIGVMPRG